MTGDYDTLYITGHSLGGALAVLAFPDLSQKVSISNVSMYNFAGPAAGDSDFVSAYEGEYNSNHVSWRIVNENDLVPKLPPLGLDCPDFSGDKCDLVDIGAQVVTYGLQNIDGISEDHKMCTYFMTLCAMTPDPTTCDARAVGCTEEDSP